MKRLKAAWKAFCYPDVFKDSIEDGLTGALTRKAFEKEAYQEISRAKRKGYPLSLAFIDLDNFKEINDDRGHKVGDLFLKLFSRLIRKSIRPYDIFSRWGGDEFVLLFPETTEEEAKEIVSRIHDLSSSFSWGVSFQDKEMSLDNLIEKADTQMYRAKKSKKEK